jgi:kynureninase
VSRAPAAADIARGDAVALDAGDPLRDFRERFVIEPGIVYLDGNSLGWRPRRACGRLHV